MLSNKSTALRTNVSFSSGKTLYAVWKAKKYTITFGNTGIESVVAIERTVLAKALAFQPGTAGCPSNNRRFGLAVRLVTVSGD